MRLRRHFALVAALQRLFGQEWLDHFGCYRSQQDVMAIDVNAVSEDDLKSRAEALREAMEPLGFSHFALASSDSWHTDPAIVG